MLTKNELTLLSNLIYKIYSVEDLTQMRQTFLESLRHLIPYEMATFELASDEQPDRVTDPVGVGTTEKEMQRYIDEIQDYDYCRWTYSAPTGGVYRETDYMDDEERVNTKYYQDYFKPAGVHYSAMLTLIRSQTFYGIVTLYRAQPSSDFSDRDLFLLNLLHDHLALRLEREKDGGATPGLPSQQQLEEEYSLTRRESEITILLLSGTSHEDICEQLHISPNTLKKHSSNIYRKTGVGSWRELMGIIVKQMR